MRIFHGYYSGWGVVFMPKDCPLTKEGIVSILEEEEHSVTIEEKAIEQADDYESDL